jgi:hypothetical protein
MIEKDFYIHRLEADEIPIFWDQIKFAIGKVYELPENMANSIYTKALGELEAGNYQCFIKRRKDEGKTLLALVITNMFLNKWTKIKTLNLTCLYAFIYSDIEGWRDFLDFVIEFSKQQGCSNITCESHVERVWEIALAIGFKESYRAFTLNLEDK